MSAKPFDPFRYSVDTVPLHVRKDLACMPVPELPAATLEPPATLKQRLGIAVEPALPETFASVPAPQRASRWRWRTLALILALGVTIAVVVLSVLRD